MAKLHTVFVYGTLQRGEDNHHLIANAGEFGGKAHFLGVGRITEKRPLVVASRYNVPFLLDTTGCGELVVGELYEVDEITLEKLDELEAHPDFYHRRLISIDTFEEDGSKVGDQVEAWCYLLPYSINDLLKYKPYLTRYSRSEMQKLGKLYIRSEEIESAADLADELNLMLQQDSNDMNNTQPS